jgi:catechol 2,3-dioxygenase-like lactoylglutathione lyase family enzyme
VAVQVSPLIHIEVVVRDAEEAAATLKRVFGAEKTQLEFARFISNERANVVHVDLGGTVIQFVEPLVDDGIWAEHLRTKGPGVHNLTFVVNDLKETIRLLEQEGARTLLEMEFDWSKVLGDRARPDAPPVTMIGSEEKLGFRLELAENPAKGEDLPTPW